MAIARDAFTTLQTTIATSLTYSFTTSGINRILHVAVYTLVASPVTGITYNGVALTKIDAKTVSSGAIEVTLWELVAPASGAHNVVISCSGAANQLGSYAISHTGALQSGQPDAHGTAGPTTTTSYTQALVTIADNSWAIWIGYTGGTSTETAGANTVLLDQDITVYGGFLADSGAAKTPAGNFTLTMASASQTFSSLMLTIAPFPPTNYTTTLTETISFSDILIRGKAYMVNLAESIMLSDTISKLLNGAAAYWTDLVDHISSWTGQNKNNSSSTDQNKNSSSWTDQDKK